MRQATARVSDVGRRQRVFMMAPKAPSAFVISVLMFAAQASPASACEYDGIPGYNHATGQIDADPYAGAYTEVAEKVARDQRQAAIERARTAFVERFGLVDADEAPGPIVAAAVIVPNAQPN